MKDIDAQRILEAYEADDSLDHHTQYMRDRDLLNPLHAAAQKAGADNINDWMIKQTKKQGEPWVNWFIADVISSRER